MATGRISDYITWLVMTNEAVVFNNNNTIQKTYKFTGKSSNLLTDEQTEKYMLAINNVLKRLKTNHILFLEAQKRQDTHYMEKTETSPLQAKFDAIRRDRLTGHRNFKVDYYLTFVYRQPNELLQKAAYMIDKDNKTILKELKRSFKDLYYAINPSAIAKDYESIVADQQVDIQKSQEKFLETTNDIILMFKKVFTDIRPLTTKETLTYLHSTISDEWHPIGSDIRTYITQRLSDATFVTGRYPMLGDKHVGIIGFKDLPKQSYPYILEKLQGIDSTFRLCSRWIALSKEDAKKEMNTLLAQHKQRKKGFFTMLWEAIQNRESDKIDDSAQYDEEEVRNAILELEQDTFSCGYYTFNLVLLNKNLDILKAELADIKSMVNGDEFVATIDQDNATSAWLSTIPSCFEKNIRKYLVHSMSFASFAPITSYYEGEEENKHFKNINSPSMPLLKCRTPENLPFYLNLHVSDIGHTFIAGATGSGKSVLLNTIACHFQKYPRSKIFIFDKSASSRILTKALGGNFYNLLVDDTIAFQPLVKIDEPTEKAWVEQWLIRYAQSRHTTITDQEEQALSTALDTIATYDKSLRTMTSLWTIIQSETWRQVLRSLKGVEKGDAGTYGHMFDSDVDKFGEGNWQLFEMEKIMENEMILGLTLEYIFHRVEESLSEDPTLIILDECWLFLRNKAFKNKIFEYIRDIRKKNASVVIATQNLSDIDDDLIPVIVENMKTKIFLPNENITKISHDKYMTFGLNEAEIDIISNLEPKKEYYYKSPLGGRVFDLHLSLFEQAFLTPTSKIDQRLGASIEVDSKEKFVDTWASVWAERNGYTYHANQIPYIT